MTEQELVILFTSLALAGVSMNVDRPHSVEWCADHAVRLAIATMAELKNKGFSWPEPVTNNRDEFEAFQTWKATQESGVVPQAPRVPTVPSARDTTTTITDQEREQMSLGLEPAT